MSHEASTWATAQCEMSCGMKLLLLVIANRANPEGVCFMGRERLAHEACCRPETVTQNMARLEAGGLLQRFQRRRENGSRTSDWIVLAPLASDRGPMHDAAPDEYPDAVAQAAREGSGAKTSCEDSPGGQVRFSGGPEPSGEPSAFRSSTVGRANDQTEFPVTDGEDVLDVPPELMLTAQQLQASKRKVGSLVVRWPEMLLAAAVVAEWNRQSGQALTLGAWLDDVVRRAREQPQLTAAQHVELVRAAWRTKWWEKRGSSRRPDLAVIYGNARQFDRCIQDATQEAESGVQPWVRTKAVQEW